MDVQCGCTQEPAGCPFGGFMSKEHNKQKTTKKPPKVRSYVRPTMVHTPRPKKKPKYPDKEIEEELADTCKG